MDQKGFAPILIVVGILIAIILIGTGYIIYSNSTRLPVVANNSPSSTQQNPYTVPRGDKIGYIHKVYEANGKNYIDFEEIQFFYGKAANEAMREDGKCYIQPGETGCFAPDGYYIRETKNHPTSTLEIATNASFTVWRWLDCRDLNPNGVPITWDQFKNGFGVFAPCKPTQSFGFDVPATSPYWIKQNENGAVTLIWEQYVP